MGRHGNPTRFAIEVDLEENRRHVCGLSHRGWGKERKPDSRMPRNRESS